MTTANIDARRLKKRAETALIDRLIAQESLGPDGIPCLAAVPRDRPLDSQGHVGLRVWCKFCVAWHLHGMGYGHRVAHCVAAESPYNQTGYYLVAATGGQS